MIRFEGNYSDETVVSVNDQTPSVRVYRDRLILRDSTKGLSDRD